MVADAGPEADALQHAGVGVEKTFLVVIALAAAVNQVTGVQNEIRPAFGHACGELELGARALAAVAEDDERERLTGGVVGLKGGVMQRAIVELNRVCVAFAGG